MGPFTVHVAAIGARKESEWLEIRGARTQPFPVRRQRWRGAGDRLDGSRCDGRGSSDGAASRKPQSCPGTQIAGAGAV